MSTSDSPIKRPPLVEAIVEQLRWNNPLSTRSSLVQSSDQTLATTDLVERTETFFAAAKLSSDGGAFAEFCETEARAAAQPQGRPSGPLDNVLVGVKELVGVKGLHQRAGSKARAALLPCVDDAVITQQLRANGAVIVGTTAMHELAFGTTGINNSYGSPQNPADTSRICGGSSSGSAAAVAAGLVDLAIGTDTGGSVRIPSALCGVVGFKPSFGTYSTEGVYPLSSSLDHVGLHATSMGDVIRFHEALSGESVASRPLTRVGIARYQLDESENDVAQQIRDLLDVIDHAGIEVVDITLPDAQLVFGVSTAIMFSEGYAVNQELMAQHQSDIGGDVRDRLLIGEAFPASTYVVAMREREAITAQLDDIFDAVDIVVGPTLPLTAPTFAEAAGDASLGGKLVSFTRLANVTGTPAVTLPTRKAGLPVGVQVMGRENSTTLSFAKIIEDLITTIGEQA